MITLSGLLAAVLKQPHHPPGKFQFVPNGWGGNSWEEYKNLLRKGGKGKTPTGS